MYNSSTCSCPFPGLIIISNVSTCICPFPGLILISNVSACICPFLGLILISNVSTCIGLLSDLILFYPYFIFMKSDLLFPLHLILPQYFQDPLEDWWAFPLGHNMVSVLPHLLAT